jgi:hypothetical protein
VIFQSAQLPPGKNIVLFGGPVNCLNNRRAPTLSPLQIEAFDTIAAWANQRENPGLRFVADSLELHEVRSAQFGSMRIYDGPGLVGDEPF